MANKWSPGCNCCEAPTCGSCGFDEDTEFEVTINGQGSFILTFEAGPLETGFCSYKWSIGTGTECGEIKNITLSFVPSVGWRLQILVANGEALDHDDSFGRCLFSSVDGSDNFVMDPQPGSCSYFNGSLHDVFMKHFVAHNRECTGLDDETTISWSIETL
jgi:hypothetical protein